MKNIKFSRLFAAALLVACFAFAGCKPQVEEVTTLVIVRPIESDDGIVGTWASSFPGEEYTITNSTFKSLNGYEGDNLCVVKTSDTSGYIYIKYTKSYEQTDTEPTGADADTWIHSPANPTWGTSEYWYRYTTTAPDVGKWYAISYKDLTSTSINLAGAGKAGGVKSTSTLEDAVKEFTIENGYFGYYSACSNE
jgi:hypothetical protein